MAPPPIRFRAATPDDRRFVRHSWFESYRRGGLAPQCAFDVYANGQGALIDLLLEDYGATVAFHPEVPDEIVGWACCAGPVVHYAYVKQAYRHYGIARTLVAGCSEFTHATRAGMHVAQRLGLRFNPFLLYPSPSP